MIITTLMDTDLYKLTMMQAVHHRFAAARAEYRFHHRNAKADLAPLADAVRKAAAAMGALSFTDEELAYLSGLDYFQADFLERLRGFRLNPEQVTVTDDDGLGVTIRGPWLETILWETPLLAIVNQLHCQAQWGAAPDLAEGRRRLAAKIDRVKSHPQAAGLRVSDFGTRRRFSRAWQEEVVATLARALPGVFIGTSNLDLARRLGLAPVGTMAHEYLQACQALAPRLEQSQTFALENWLDEFQGRLGIALSDVCGMDAFLRDFSADLARRYAGARHDSGDPFLWGEKLIGHYESLGIDPQEKQLVFSDGLTMERALALQERFRARSQPLFGIGTHLTNDVGLDPLSIVIKMTRLNGQPVAKLSDSPGKTLCDDPDYLQRLARAFGKEGPS